MRRSMAGCVTSAAVLLLAGCFSDSDDGQVDGAATVTSAAFEGSTGAATVDSNAQAADLARASLEGAARAIKSKTLAIPMAALIRNTDVDDSLTANLLSIIARSDQLNLLPSAATSLADGDCGGAIDTESDHDHAVNPENGTVSFRYRYDQYCTVTTRGRVITDGKGDYTARYREGDLSQYTIAWDLTHSRGNGGTVTSSLRGTTTCHFSNGTISCGYSEDFPGADGEIYRIENVSVREDRNGNSSVSGRVYDARHGFVNFRASDIDWRNCDNGGFAAGSIAISSVSGEALARMSFPDCSEFIVTFGGNAETYPQPDHG